MEATITRYFSNLFSSQNPSIEDIAGISSMVPNGVTQDMNNYLDTPFTKEEIKKALFDLHPSKAPGPDGYTALFFQNVWDVIGEKVTKAALDVLNCGASLGDWNHTVVTIIPKVKDPTILQDFRLICLCKVSYKIIARAIANRLKGIMDKIIDQYQSTFIPGRAISDNIIIGYECMYWLRNNTSNQGYVALKLDMSKAYDRVEWPHLHNILSSLGFSRRWIDLVMMCITTVSYSFKVNGHLTESITPSRDLRQGDPISPYLFVICTQGLSAIINHKANQNMLRGIKSGERKSHDYAPFL